MEFILEQPIKDQAGNNRQLLNSGATVLLGLSSVGNVGQLSIDILLATLSQGGESMVPIRVGSLRSNHLHPIIGFESFDNGKTKVTCKPLEVYRLQHPTKVIYAVIQRTFCRKNGSRALAKDLIEFFSASSVSNIVVLTGASTEFVDINRSATNASYLQLTRGPATTPICGGLPGIAQWVASLPALNENVIFSSLSTEESSHKGSYVITSDTKANGPVCVSEDDQGKAPLGMILPKLLLSELDASSSPIRLTIIGKFVNEGLNVIDGRDLADSLLKAISESYAAPISTAASGIKSLLVDSSFGGDDIFTALREKELRMRRNIRYPSSWQRLLEQHPGL